MIRKQIQLPGDLHAAARELAARREISLAELMRQGLEYMLSISPGEGGKVDTLEFPETLHLGGDEDPFGNRDWRVEVHMQGTRVRF